MDMEEEMPESSPETVEPPSQETIPDYAQGYEISLCVYPDGYEVKGPNPLPQSAVADRELQDASSESASERIADLGDTLKHIIAITKEHPLDSDMVTQFDAGYESES
jgi:hypothetical protein